LLATNSFFVRKGDDIAAFLTEKDAQAYATTQSSQVITFDAL
jgi:hypothetical protein